jgi:SAM-dependent methyltransferase
MSDAPMATTREAGQSSHQASQGRHASAAALVLACPACGADVRHDFRFRKNRSDIYQCSSCGLGRAEAAGFDPNAYYTEDYFDGGHADGYADYQGAEPVLRQEFAGTVEFVRRFRSSGRLLELGCAYGFFLQEAKRHFAVSGIELAPSAAEHCRRSGLNVLQGAVDRANLERLGRQDAVVMLDVIEHLPDPLGSLQLAADYLDPGGVLVITTGDFGSIAAKIMGKGWRLMTPPQHLWYFTTQSMHRLAARTGLRVECIDHPWKLVPASLILFQLRRMLGLKASGGACGRSFGVPVNLFDAMRVVMRKP